MGFLIFGFRNTTRFDNPLAILSINIWCEDYLRLVVVF